MPRFVHSFRGQREEEDRVVPGCAVQRGHEDSGAKLSKCTAVLATSLIGLVLDNTPQKVLKDVSGVAKDLDVSVHMVGAAASNREAVKNVTRATPQKTQEVEGNIGQLEEAGGGLHGRSTGTSTSKVQLGGTISLDQEEVRGETEVVVAIPESTMLSSVTDCSCVESIGQLGKYGVNVGSDGVQVNVSSVEEVSGSPITIRKRGKKWKRLAQEVGSNQGTGLPSAKRPMDVMEVEEETTSGLKRLKQVDVVIPDIIEVGPDSQARRLQ